MYSAILRITFDEQNGFGIDQCIHPTLPSADAPSVCALFTYMHKERTACPSAASFARSSIIVRRLRLD